MSRKGNCWDNAGAEFFSHSLKTQMIHHVRVQNALEVERALFDYIEVYFNRQRKHSTNGFKATALFEEEWWSKRKTA